MKNLKLLLALVLCLALVFTCMFSLSSCKKDENPTPDDNAGDNSTDQPSADQPGADQPGGDNPPAHTHSYTTSVITKYPGVNTKGVKTFYCSCGDSYTEDIEAVTINLPSLASIVASVIGEHTYALEIGADSKIVLVKEADIENQVNGYKDFVAFKVAEASVSGEGGVFKGSLSVELGYTSIPLDGSVDPDTVLAPENFDKVTELDVYVNGEAVSVSYGVNGDVSTSEVENISRELYSSIAESVGLTYDQLTELYYAASQLETFLPLVEGVINAVKTNVPQPEVGIEELVAMIAGSVFTTEQDGNNVVYVLDIEGLNELLLLIEDKTVAELIDAEFGEGTAKAVSDFIISIPTATVKQITEKAATFSESCGIRIEQVYAFINYVVSIASGAEFDIAAQIEANANKTVAAIIGEAYGNENIAEYEKVLSENLTELVNLCAGSTIDELFALVSGTDPEEMTLTALLHNYISMLDGAIGFRVSVDAEGNLVYATVDLAEGTLDVNIDGSIITVLYNENGDELLNAEIHLFDNGELREASIVVNYVDTEYEKVLDSTGTEYTVVEKKVVKTALRFNYNNMVTDMGCHYITLVTEDITINATIGDNSDENGTVLKGTFNVVEDSEEIATGTVSYVATATGESFELTYAGKEGDNTVISYQSDANGMSLLVENNENVMLKLAYTTSVDENGVESFDYIECIIGDYAYETEGWLDENDEWQKVSVDVYYEALHALYEVDENGNVSYSLTVYDVNYNYFDEYDENGYLIHESSEPELEVVLTVNGDAEHAEIVGTDYEVEINFLENGISVDATVNGLPISVSILTQDDGTLGLYVEIGGMTAELELNVAENGVSVNAFYNDGTATVIDGSLGLALESTETSDTLVISIDLDKLLVDYLEAIGNLGSAMPDEGEKVPEEIY